MLEIKITGLEGLAEAIKSLATAMGETRELAIQKGVPKEPAQENAQTVPVTKSDVQEPAPQSAAAVQTSTIAYKLDDLARAAMQLMDSGRQGELQQMLATFGVSSLPELPEEKYGAFATALREKGAQI